LLEILRAIEPSAHEKVAAQIAKFEADLEMRLDQDLLDLLGETFVLYDAPENGGFWFSGVTCVAQCSDPAKVRESLKKLANALGGISEKVGVAVTETEYRGHNIEFVNVAGLPVPIAPAWCVHKGRMVFGLYPQMVITALDRILDANPRTDSLLANPDFVRARRLLGGLGSSFSYSDAPADIAAMYAWLLPISQIGAAMAQGAGIQVDVTAFPTRKALTQHMFAHVSTSRTDAHGALCASYGPLPFTLPSLSAGGAGFAVPMTVAILLPSLSRARHQAKRAVSAANLRGIGQGCVVYANDHAELYPPDLKTLIDTGLATERMLHAPHDRTDQVSYVYISGQTVNDHPRNVLAHERLDIDPEGANVLLLDTSVRFMTHAKLQKALEETRARMAVPKAGGGPPG
jgi:hypothetical protein